MLTIIACTYCSLKHNSKVTRTELYSDDVLKYSNVSKTLNNSYFKCHKTGTKMVNMSETFVALISLNGGNYYHRGLIIFREQLC